MATEHMSDNEVTTNFDAVLEKLFKGVEVIVERDHRPVAVITPPPSLGTFGTYLGGILPVLDDSKSSNDIRP